MKTKILYGIFIILLIGGFACKKKDSPASSTTAATSTTPTVLPDTFSIALPTSMTSVTRSVYSGDSIGKTAFTKISALTQRMKGHAAKWLGFLDTLISTYSLSPSSTEVSSKTITVDANLIAKIKSYMPDDIESTYDFTAVTGKTITIPAFVYDNYSDSNNLYDRKFELKSANTDGFTLSVYWHTTQKNLKTELVNMLGKFIFTYNNSTSVAKMVYINDETNTVGEISAQKDSSVSTGNAALVTMAYRSEENGSAVSVQVKSYADDSGAFYETRVAKEQNGTMNTIDYKEEVNGTGEVTYQAMSSDGSNYMPVVGSSASSAYTDSYDTKVTATTESALNDKTAIEDTLNTSGLIVIDVTGAEAGASYLVLNSSGPASDIALTGLSANSAYFIGYAYGVKSGQIQLEIWKPANYTSGAALKIYKRTAANYTFVNQSVSAALQNTSNITVLPAVGAILVKEDFKDLTGWKEGFLTFSFVLKKGLNILDTTDTASITSLKIIRPDNTEYVIDPNTVWGVNTNPYKGYFVYTANNYKLFAVVDTSVNTTNASSYKGIYKIDVNNGAAVYSLNLENISDTMGHVSNIGAVVNTSGQTVISWTAPSNASGVSGYRVLIFETTTKIDGTKDYENWAKLVYNSSKTMITGTTHTLPSEIVLKSGTEYAIKVEALNGAGGSFYTSNLIYRSTKQSYTPTSTTKSDIDINTAFVMSLKKEYEAAYLESQSQTYLGSFWVLFLAKRGGLYLDMTDSSTISTITITRPASQTSWTISPNIDYAAGYNSTTFLYNGYMQWGENWRVKLFMVGGFNIGAYGTLAGDYTVTMTDNLGRNAVKTLTMTSSTDPMTGYPNGISYNKDTKVVTWTGVTGANGYRVAIFKDLSLASVWGTGTPTAYKENFSKMVFNSAILGTITTNSYTLPSSVTFEAGAAYYIMVDAFVNTTVSNIGALDSTVNFMHRATPTAVTVQ
ncbi:MAG TPA: hypothetical protein DHW82_03670 [Spirochaetia bacterium]|nr:MAG: hypothetical protein A2Y41_06855 [Spirochaetes bacterium GWB1_36_13]HCL56092.1 hypothetical protein [Spirochaetia bacterium]